jgi:predicted FMN-binding regulatory protein PaiB
MIYYDYYADVPSQTLDEFVRDCEMGRLVTVSPDGSPHIGLYPFVYEAGVIEMHFNRADEQFADLKSRAHCLFEVDEILGTVPSYWVHPEDAVKATAYHRTVVFECEAILSQDPAQLAAQQSRLLARYQPEGGFRPVAPEDDFYRVALQHIVSVRLEVTARRVKFKLAQNRPIEARRKIVGALRARGRPADDRAADAVQWTIDQETGKPACR